MITGAYCNYDNSPANAEIYGCLYKWYVLLDKRNVAPEGWHVPTDTEWKWLEISFGMSQSEANETSFRGRIGGLMRATGTLEEGTGLWHSNRKGSTDVRRFSALPRGCRSGYDGGFGDMGYTAEFWCAPDHFRIDAWRVF